MCKLWKLGSGKTRSRHPGTITERTLTYLKNAHKGCVTWTDGFPNYGRRPTLGFLTRLVALLSLPQLTAFQQPLLLYYKIHAQLAIKRRTASGYFVLPSFPYFFFCRALSSIWRLIRFPQILVFIPVLRIEVPGFSIRSQLSKFS
jgi:hypothetical protein